MEKFTRYCTKEQVKLAYKLSAPIHTSFCPENTDGYKPKDWVIVDPLPQSWSCIMGKIPTTQQMIGWLITKNIEISIDSNAYGYHTIIFDNKDNIIAEFHSNGKTYNEHLIKIELDSIDAALKHLSKIAKK